MSSATTTPEPTAEEPKAKTTRTANPELQVMAKIDRLLSEELTTDESRARVVSWLTSYYGPTRDQVIDDAR